MPEPQDDPRIYFALERTFLAWLRTGLALMGIGFAVSRFSLFLRQIRPTGPHTGGPSVYVGVGLVALGVVVNLAAMYSHVRTTHELRSGAWTPGISFHAAALACLLAAAGAGLAVFLLIIR